ncbi:hypothetical protein T484DRAFT_1757914, partial [Baffinella frigidus]
MVLTNNTQQKEILSAVRPLQLLLSTSNYEIVSLGQSDELFEWVIGINPAVTLGVYWMEDTEALDLCIGMLCIRYEEDIITASTPNNLSLAPRQIPSDTFRVNPVVSYQDQRPYTPMWAVNNVTVILKTHVLGGFALSTSAEMSSVALYTMGYTINLGVSYEELYELIAVPAHIGLPYVFVGMQYQQTVTTQHEKMFLGPSNFRLGTVSPSAEATSDSSLAALVFIAPCFDKFVQCGEVKTILMFSLDGIIVTDVNEFASNNGGQQRRLLDQYILDTTEFDVNSSSYITLKDATDSIVSETSITDETILRTPGLIISNMDSTHHTTPTGLDLEVKLIDQHHVSLEVCGVVFVSERLYPGVWHELGFTVKTQSILTIFYDSDPSQSKRFLGTGDNKCTINNHITTIGKSPTFKTVLVQSGSIYSPLLETVREIVVSYLQGRYGTAPLSTYATTNGAEAVIFARVYIYTELDQTFAEVSDVLSTLNEELLSRSLPPLKLPTTRTTGRLDETIIPFLMLNYVRSPPLVCSSYTHTKTCIYDNMTPTPGPHTPTFNDHVFTARVQDGSFSDDFSVGGGDFAIPANSLIVYSTAADGSANIIPWGSGYDAAMDVFVRTGPDTLGATINLCIVIPTNPRSPSMPFKLYVDAKNVSTYDTNRDVS